MNVLEKISEEIKNLKRKQNSSNQDYYTGYLSALSTVEGIIAGMDCGWIPVTERLPEDIEYVLVTVSGKYEWTKFDNAVMIGDYDFRSNDWIIEGLEEWKNPNVTAWMPLPEAYKGV